jgi:hypothetical protein
MLKTLDEIVNQYSLLLKKIEEESFVSPKLIKRSLLQREQT